MANPYFSNLPEFLYVNRTKEGRSEGDYSTVVNLFKRAKLREDIFQDVSFFSKYIVEGDDRPDNVAFKVYNDPDLDWVVLMSNNKSREVKATDGSVIIQSGQKVGVGQSVSYYDYALGQHVRATDVAIPVTNFEHEDNLNNKKREIFVLKREYLKIIFDDLKEIMAYKKGSTQYVNRTLVRGDNIRLTN